MNENPTITLLTDFGTRDGFIGVMKGVMMQIIPHVRLIDISHDLPPFSISAAAFLNEWSYGYFPQGTIHLCVVDPGVGTRRRVIAVESAGHTFVGPDNGLFTHLFESGETTNTVHITNEKYWLDKISNTFHGRDIFSPVAAYLAKGVSLDEMGEPINDPVLLPFHPLVVMKNRIECRIRYIDRFGNLVTNLDKETFDDWCAQNNCSGNEVVIIGTGQKIDGISKAYGDKERGELLAVFDGFDRLEISVSGGNAVSTTGLAVEDTILVAKSDS